MRELLTRIAFREGVLARDNYSCVFCGKPAQDAHHILERRLWPDGGYYLDNGASVCGEHHLLCESTEIDLDTVRQACKITKPIIPPHLYDDMPYDKWGNPVLPNGQRLRGELFFDPSIQKVLAPVLNLFTHLVKYPRTHHLPWSENVNDDDRMMSSTDAFQGKEVVVTTKMDGENTTMYQDHIHARSLDSISHPSRSWVKGFWASIRMDIPEAWRICGENLYAEHSIAYNDLPSYFLGFSVWNDQNICLNWDDTQEWFGLLGITSVPVLYRGIYDEAKIKALWSAQNWERMEGYVVRLTESFPAMEFRHKMGKFVRAKHVQTVKHWMHGQPMKVNQLG